jgi:hypothetical protein
MSAFRMVPRLAGVCAAALVAVLVAAPAGAKPAAVDQCFTCHHDGGTPQAMSFVKDVHYEAGVTCADCHGGDPTKDDQDLAMSAAAGYRGKHIKKSDIPSICGKCHGGAMNEFKREHRLSDVADSLAAGVHGEALRNSENGPQCVSCHGVHNIVRVSDPSSPVHPSHVVKTCATCHSDAKYMHDFNPRLPVDQFTMYLTSVHGQRNAKGDFKVATCVSCHSNHLVYPVKDPRAPVYPTRVPETCAKCHGNAKYMAEYRIPTDQYLKYRKSRHGIALLEKSDLNAPACNSCHGNHGAAPPGAASIVAMCGNCHQANAELYQKSVHRDAFAKKNLAGCVVCHGNHDIEEPTDALVGFEPPAPCGQCHTRGGSDTAEPGIVHMRSLLDSLSLGKQRADRQLDQAEQLGMDVADAKYDLRDVNQALVQARVAIHSFKVQDLADAIHPGIAILAAAEHAGEEAVHDYYFRRQGLAVSTLIVTLVAVLLYLKIREIEKEKKK